MRALSHMLWAMALAPLVLSACTFSLLATPEPPATTTSLASTSPTTAVPTSVSPQIPTTTTALSTALPTTAATMPPAFCDDPQPKALIAQFEAAVKASNGETLAALVSPDHGMDARLFRDGRVVNYDRIHAAALFESTFELTWGRAPGSGLDTSGSFHELFLPDLLDVLSRDYELDCNRLRVGGTTYTPSWPYPGIYFYSLHFPGTPAFDGLDWHTWVLGMHYFDDKPFLYAIMQYKWEP